MSKALEDAILVVGIWAVGLGLGLAAYGIALAVTAR